MAEPKQFELNAERVEAILAQGRECADSADASALLERARTGYELSPEEAARLWLSESDHESIYAAAREAQQRRALDAAY